MPLPFRSYVLQLSALTLHPHAINHITIWSWYNVVWCQLGPECGKWSQVPWQDVDVKEDSRVHDYMIASFSPSPWGKTNFDLVDDLPNVTLVFVPLQWSTGLRQGLESLPMWWFPVRSWC